MRFAALLLCPLFALCQGVSFEVATIKPSDPNTRASPERQSGLRVTGDRVEIRDMNLRFSIGRAYQVRPIYVFGEDWLDTRFDISAKIPDGATAAQIPEMLQTLLAERFGVKMHFETRSMPVFVLRVAKSGFKLKEVPPDTPNATRSSQGTMVVVGTLDALGATATFAGLLDPLVDQTGIKGKYEIPLNPSLIYDFTNRDPLDDSGALARMQEAVGPHGLTIERARIPSQVVVVDHIEHAPSGN